MARNLYVLACGANPAADLAEPDPPSPLWMAPCPEILAALVS